MPIDLCQSIHNNQALRNQQPIGIFDSGIGGLSISQQIKHHLPNENLLYVADTLHAPYGDKSTEFITQRVNDIADWFIKQQAKAIVVACNTATVNAIDQLRYRVDIPVIGVEPAIKPAAKHSINDKVAILVTQATAKNPRFLALVEKYQNNCQVFIQPCPGLVEAIELGKESSAHCYLLLEKYLTPLLKNGVDTIVLGCTHYPFVTDAIQKICGKQIKIMETALPVTEQLKRQLIVHQIANPQDISGSITFYSSQNGLQQQQLFSHLWQTNVELHRLD